MIDDIKVVDSDGATVEPSTKKDIGTVEGSTTHSTGVYESVVAQVLGMDISSLTGALKGEYDAILEYAKSQTGKEELTTDKLAWILRDLDMRIGASPFAEKRIYKVARFITLNKQKAQIDEELKGFREY
jgi:hypothetical protein